MIDMGDVSDGSHTSNELYEHRHSLTLALMRSMPQVSWFSRAHNDGSSFDGWFIVGIDLPTGTITYHMPERLYEAARATGAKELDKGQEWDGHTSQDVVERLVQFATR